MEKGSVECFFRRFFGFVTVLSGNVCFQNPVACLWPLGKNASIDIFRQKFGSHLFICRCFLPVKERVTSFLHVIPLHPVHF